MTVGRSISEKSDRMTWRSKWMPRWEKFSKKSFRALSSQNCTWEGVESEEVDAPEWRGFWDGVDFGLGAIAKLTKEIGRERNKQKSTNNININIKINKGTYAWKCMNMWHANLKTSWAQPNPNLPAHINSTYIAHNYNTWKYSYNENVMQCMKI